MRVAGRIGAMTLKQPMRFRRTILRSFGLRSFALRGLAPLLSLSALMTAMAAGVAPSDGPPPDVRTLARLLRSVVDFVTPAVEHISANTTASRPSPQAVLAFAALASTHLCHSLWMVTRPASAVRFERRQQLQPLRC